MHTEPKSGFKGLIENWQSDVIASVSVALVAMPLGLGIAIASGLPPMSGIITAVIGGIVATFFRGSHLAINGPTAGLIAVMLSSIAMLDDGSGSVLNYLMAAIIISGVLQVALGLFKLGKFAHIFHSTVIHGILAAIGVIIIAKQIHIAMGTVSNADEIVGTLIDAVRQIPNINPFVGIISLVGILLLSFQSKISYKLFHLIPAPVWLIILAVPFVFLFDFFEDQTYLFLGNEYAIGPKLLVNLPNNLLDAIIFPNFSKMHTLPFWISVVSITVIGSIESLAGSKAVDKLDPYKRKTDLNKDLIGIGLSTMVSGAIGGLPVITVIARSSVNVHNNAKTKWSNLYHGLLLLLFVFILAPVIKMVPLCALAILLVHTGYKLASPKVFKQMYSHGPEQLIFFVGTLVITLFTNLMVGLFGGLALALLVHWLLSMVPLREFLRMIFNSGSNLFTNTDGSYVLHIKGIANFLATLKIEGLLARIQPGTKVTIDFSETKLVDHSIMENLYEFKRSHNSKGGQVILTGLGQHNASCSHKLALQILPKKLHEKFSRRQIQLQELASNHNWYFETTSADDLSFLESFYFFKSRPIEIRRNTLTPLDDTAHWEISDVKFEEGAYEAADAYETTLCLVRDLKNLPKFVIEKKSFTDYLNISWHKDIDFHSYPNFSKNFLVKVDDVEKMNAFVTPELILLVEQSNISHLESNGEAIMLFDANLRLAQISDYSELVRIAESLKKLQQKT
jgi:MFS superfamily sulfate permease-like transporter